MDSRYFCHIRNMKTIFEPKIMRNFSFLLLTLLAYATGLQAQTQSETVHINDLNVRDPYIVADPEAQVYYLYKSSPIATAAGTKSGVVAYTSKDLKQWEGPHTVFITPDDNWITGAIWAPEVHVYKGRYYLFATLNSDIEWRGRREDWPPHTFRGTQIFHADSPMGPFLPFADKMPHTPIDRMALDGTLWVEDGRPYMIYCYEWVEAVDGTMELVELTDDLSATVGPSIRLFNASSAIWATGNLHEDGTMSYVTDGCFVYRTKTGKLLMIWSSFKDGKYAIGIAESVTGKLVGPWRQQDDLLFGEHGGHGMIFKKFDGQLMLTFHQPNSPGGAERAVIYELSDEGDTLRVVRAH